MKIKEFLSHPMILLIAGSVLTYLIIPSIQQLSFKRSAKSKYIEDLVNHNFKLTADLNEVLNYVEHFNGELYYDTLITKGVKHKLQHEYNDKIRAVLLRFNKSAWFETRSFRNKIFLSELKPSDDTHLIDSYFQALDQNLKDSNTSCYSLYNHVIRNKRFAPSQKNDSLISQGRNELNFFYFKRINLCKLISKELHKSDTWSSSFLRWGLTN